MLEKLTIVIPTYERHDYIKRTMMFWKDYNVQLIVIDGSALPVDSEFIAKLPSSILYIHDQSTQYNRILKAGKLVETEYVILGCDDEFYVPSALLRCISELDKDEELVSCGGVALGFYSENRVVYGRPIYPRLINKELKEKSAVDRVRKHLSNYDQAHLYSVCRTAVWVYMVSHVFKHEYPFFACWELQIEILIPAAGKSKVVPELLWMRGYEAAPIRGTSSSMSRDIVINEWWESSLYSENKIKFINEMNAVNRELCLITNNPYEPCVVEGVEAYLEWSYKYSRKRSTLKTLLFTVLPNYLKAFVKRLRNKFIGPKKGWVELSVAARSLGVLGVHIDYDDLKKIESVIRKFHRNHLDQNSVSSI